MSRIGRRPIPVPGEVDLTLTEENHVTVSGPKGTMTQAFSPDLIFKNEGGIITIERPSDHRHHRSLHGLSRTLLSNMVTGVTTGFRKNLDMTGVGYRATMDGKTLVLNVGYSHPVRIIPVDGIAFAVEGVNKISVTGFDKQVVGEEAARIRRVRPPEPYKGKGIRYEGEVIRRKAGKTGKAK
jgi:large subunit ribosomal protein L6